MLEQGLVVESAYYFWILGALSCLHLHAAFKDVVPVPVVIILLIECQSQNQQWADKSRQDQDEMLLGSWLLVGEGRAVTGIYLVTLEHTPCLVNSWQWQIPLVGIDILLLVAWVMHDSWRAGTIHSVTLELGLGGKYIFSLFIFWRASCSCNPAEQWQSSSQHTRRHSPFPLPSCCWDTIRSWLILTGSL